MLKKIISMLLLSAFVMNVVFVLPVFAGHRIQDAGGGTVTLEARDRDVPENATGTAKFKIDKKADGVNRMTVTIHVENLPEQAQRVYEVWLISDNGTDMNLTSFNTNNDGNATTTTKRGVINLAPFDSIKISTKRIESFGTSRTGDTVLSGRLHRGGNDNFDDDDDFDGGHGDSFDDDDFDDDDFNGDHGDDFDDDSFDDDFDDDDFNGDHGDDFDDDDFNDGDDFDDDDDFDDHGDNFDADFDDDFDDDHDFDNDNQRRRHRRQHRQRDNR